MVTRREVFFLAGIVLLESLERKKEGGFLVVLFCWGLRDVFPLYIYIYIYICGV
jgi:hypothetical protein